MKLHRYFYPDGNFELLYLCDYYPVDRYKQEFYNNNCSRLLNFRQNISDSLDYIRGYLYNDPYWQKLTSELEGEDVHLYAFPSCTIDNFKSGLYPLVEDLCRANESFFDAAKCLVRTRTLESEEKVSGHMATIEKSRCCEITDESIAILFDDVTTNGASLKAGHDILKAAGYKTIICIAIAKVYRPDEESEEIDIPVIQREE